MAVVESSVFFDTLRKFRFSSIKKANPRSLNFLSPLSKVKIITREHSQVELRNESAVETSKDHLQDVGLNVVSYAASEMPFMVPTQAVPKGHQVHQSPRFFAFKPHEKMSWLTKTCFTEGMPNEVEQMDNCDESVLELCKEIVHQIAAFQRNPKSPSTTFHEEEFTLGLIQDLVRVFTCSNSAAGLSNDLFIQRKPPTEMNWFRNFNFYHAKYQPSIILRSKTPLPKLDVDFPLPLGE